MAKGHSEEFRRDAVCVHFRGKLVTDRIPTSRGAFRFV